MNSKQNPVAIVTGAFSGIGLGATQALIKPGYDVLGTSLSISPSNELKASSDLALIAGDISKKETTAKVAAAAIKHVDRIDLLVNPDRRASHFLQRPPGQQSEWLDRIFVLHALKVGLAGVLSLFVAQALRLQYPEWAPFTVMVLMMVHPHPGSIALKSLFRVVGTLAGASLGVWLVSDYVSSPILFLSVTFLVMGLASYKVGQLSSAMAPYAYFLTGVTLIVVESSALTQPDQAWFIALSRAEETFVGIAAVLIINPLFRPRSPRQEFQQLARSAVDQLEHLTNAELQNIKEGTGSNSEVLEQQTAVLRKLLSLDSLLLAERRESLYFRANTAVLQKVLNSLRNLFQAVSELSRLAIDWRVLNGRFEKQLKAAQDLLKHGFANVGRTSVEGPSMVATGFQTLDDEISHWLGAGEFQKLPADQLAAYLRCWSAFRRIQNELVSLYDLPNQLQRCEPDPVLQSDPPKTQRKIDRRLVMVGVKGGLATVVSLFLLEWLHLPGASIMPVAAWLAVIFTSYQIPSGRPGHIRTFRSLLLMALYGIGVVLALLVLTPFLSNYWFMNLILFCILFAHGYFASKTSGLAFWMLGTIFLVSILVGLNAQKPVPFAEIVDSCLGVITGLTLGVTIARVLWPRLPQKELKDAAARFCDVAKLALAENPAVSMSSINSNLSALPLDIARTTTVLGVNCFLRQEQAKWNRLIPVLMCTGDQLSRLTSIRGKFIDSEEVRLYLDSLHQDFRTWMDALGCFFRRPDGHQTLPSVQGLIDRLKQRLAGLTVTAHPSSNGSASEALIDVHEYLVTAELMRLCGDIASSLRLVEYSGDYFL
jgi:uncharacterized membrane protein YccC